jgi:site-specific DNA-methyltransferase (adenine-specific)
MAVAIEDGGFEIRDIIFWVYSTGFPKALDVSKAIDATDAKDEQQARRLRFTAWVRAQGVTAKAIDTATGTKMGGHYVSPKSQPAIMTREHLEKCRHLFADVPEWVTAEANQRSVESENLANRIVVSSYRTHDLQADRPVAIAAQGRQKTKHKNVEVTEAFTPEAAAWAGWKTAIKPACEPITVARKRPGDGIAETVLEFGTGAMNVEALRAKHGGWPTNVWHDNSPEVRHQLKDAARVFYVPKPSRIERDRGLEQMNDHPTVKPIQVMRDLIRLVTPPGGLVLDPYTGSGTTGCAAILEGFRFLGFEQDKNHMGKARRRIRHSAARVLNGGRQLELF